VVECVGSDVTLIETRVVTEKSLTVLEHCPYGCVDGECRNCTPKCTNKTCGDDGCGGTCGLCEPGVVCETGKCKCAALTRHYCWQGSVATRNACGTVTASLKPCPYGCADGACLPCAPTCAPGACGGDGCGGQCPGCADGLECVAGKCECAGDPCVCDPSTCECPPATGERVCLDGAVWRLDGCGEPESKVVDCPNGCADAACFACEVSCGGRQCGDDGCGGSCGACVLGRTCDEAGACVCPPDTCDTGGACVAAGAPCDDGDPCTGFDRCDAGACSGTAIGCGVHNIVFVSASRVHIGELGGLAGADAFCQAEAQSAGLPGTYVAWLSTDSSDAIDRLESPEGVPAEGWVRPDGLPVFVDRGDVATFRLRYRLGLDQFSRELESPFVATNTWAEGKALPESLVDATGTCYGLTSTDGLLRTGSSASVGAEWTTYGFEGCSRGFHLYCFGVDHATPLVLPPPPPQARLAFLSAAKWQSGGGLESADALCAVEAASAGLSGEFIALLGQTGEIWSERLDLDGEPWYRPDGVRLVDDPIQLATPIAGHYFLEAAVAIEATGAFPAPNGLYPQPNRVWTGTYALESVGRAEDTCQSWTALGGYGLWSEAEETGTAMHTLTQPSSCSNLARLLCYER
jgi:hypothetical protein